MYLTLWSITYIEYLYLGKLKVGKLERKFCFHQRYLYLTSYLWSQLIPESNTEHSFSFTVMFCDVRIESWNLHIRQGELREACSHGNTNYIVTLGSDGAFGDIHGNDFLNRLLPRIWKTELFDKVFPIQFVKDCLRQMQTQIEWVRKKYKEQNSRVKPEEARSQKWSL
jgi:hypothetical protein